MKKFYEQYLNRMEAIHHDILNAMQGLSEDALDWMPGPDMNSIAVMVYHLTGAERYWIGDVVAQDPSGRDRDGEFRVHNVGVDVLKRRLADNLEYARNVVVKLSLTDLARKCVSPRDGESFTVAWALLHALEHSAIHLGHIEMTRQLRIASRGNP